MAERISNKSVILSSAFAGIVALSCGREANVPKTQTFLGPTEVSPVEKYKRADLDEILAQSIRPEFMSVSKFVRSEPIEGGTQWRFSMEHNQFGQKEIDSTSLVVNIYYERLAGLEKYSQYSVQVSGLDEVSKGNLKDHFKQKAGDPLKSIDKAVVKTIDSTPGRVSETTTESIVEKPLDANQRALELLKAAEKFFFIPFNPNPKVESPKELSLIVVQGSGKNAFGWDTEITVNSLGAAEYKVKRKP